MARILVVDDSLSARRGIAEMLHENGHKTLQASNGLEALDLTTEQKPDLVILDLLMPDMDGFDVLAEMKKRNLKTPVVILSSDIQETTRQECERLGAGYFLNKPVHPGELAGAIDKILETNRG